jgi:hypothetical protein
MEQAKENEFVGYSPRNDFGEALANAISQAKRVLATDHVVWNLIDVYGEDGGFAQVTELYVRISAGLRLAEATAGPAFFDMRDVNGDSFVIKLWDPATIAHARRIVSGEETGAIHVIGKVVDSRVAYNPEWAYHLDPSSIGFFENAVEVCDATIRYVEDHLIEVGGAFLPGSIWCPWTSTLVRELSEAELKAQS